MVNELFFFFTWVSGLAYTYCLFRVHFLAVKLDRCIRLPRSRSGEIRLADLQLIKSSATTVDCEADAQSAITILRFSNGVVISHLTFLVFYAINTLY